MNFRSEGSGQFSVRLVQNLPNRWQTLELVAQGDSEVVVEGGICETPIATKTQPLPTRRNLGEGGRQARDTLSKE